MTDILQSSDGRSMLLCIFVTCKAKAVLFLNRAVLLCTFHFPRKGFWHNVVLIKGDFCSILFRLVCFSTQCRGRGWTEGFWRLEFYFLELFPLFLLFPQLTPGQNNIFLPISTAPEILTCAARALQTPPVELHFMGVLGSSWSCFHLRTF